MLIIKDNALPQSMISDIVEHYYKNPAGFWQNPDKLISNWYTETMDWQQELLNQAGNYFDLGDMIGFESWGHINSRPDWHVDRDELAFQNGFEERPLCSIVFYPTVRLISGGHFVTETETIRPKTNRAIFFSPGLYHNVEPWRGERMSVAINPWNFLPYTYRHK